MGDSVISIVVVRPALLGTYGDGGNALVLQRRLRRRGLAAEIWSVEGTDTVPRTADIIVLGGGEDDAQLLVAADIELGASLRSAVAAGAAVLAVCAGFQLLGSTFETVGRTVEGFGVLDCTSHSRSRRAVGEVVAEATIPGIATITGFENHRAGSTLGPGLRPLSQVVVGTGNGDDGGDGALDGRVFATYLHGPVLARNPDLADAVLEAVTGPLPPLVDDAVDVLRQERLAAASRDRGVHVGWRWRRRR